MSPAVAWQVKGIYFEACNCDSVCPCYSAHPPTHKQRLKRHQRRSKLPIVGTC